MLLQAWSLSSGLLLCRCYSHSTYYCGNFISKPSSSSSSCCCCSKAAAATTIKVVCRSVGINDLAEITHNKVCIALYCPQIHCSPFLLCFFFLWFERKPPFLIAPPKKQIGRNNKIFGISPQSLALVIVSVRSGCTSSSVPDFYVCLGSDCSSCIGSNRAAVKAFHFDHPLWKQKH